MEIIAYLSPKANRQIKYVNLYKALGPVPGAESGLPQCSRRSGESSGHAQAQESEGPKFKSQLCLLLPVLPRACSLSLSSRLLIWEEITQPTQQTMLVKMLSQNTS